MKLLTLFLLFQLYPTPERLDLNTASKVSLMGLEGVTPEIADTIIKGRPYESLNDVKISNEVLKKIAGSIYVKKGEVAVIDGGEVKWLRFEVKEKERAEAPIPAVN